jgi:hypothetical protein
MSNPNIRTDWLGRATYGGPMAGDYFSAWFVAFPDHRDSGQYVEAGSWQRDTKGHHWWVTGTPDWDWAWFISQGVKPPKRLGSPDNSSWKSHGGGLSQGVYVPKGKP